MKLILKLLIKATLPMLIMFGVIGYMVYLKGGDPMAMYRLVLGNIGAQSSEMGQNAQDQVSATLSQLRGVLPGDDSESGSTPTILYRWVDEDGITQFTQEPPVHVEATRLSINPDTNLMQSPNRSAESLQPEQTEPGLDQEALPGIGGVMANISGAAQ